VIRPRRTITSLALAASGLALAATHFVAPETSSRVGVDVCGMAEARDALTAETLESARLRDEQRRLAEIIGAEDGVTARLISGQLTLAEASDLTVELLSERSVMVDAVGRHFPAPTFRLSAALHLIDRVRRVAASDPSLLALLEPRLDAEYAAMEGEAFGPRE
jgi:hypothetical protein